jgi:hypothetical protein
MVFDTSTSGPATELAPQASSQRRAPAIGGNTVAWTDFEFGQSEVLVHDLGTAVATRLTNDAVAVGFSRHSGSRASLSR